MADDIRMLLSDLQNNFSPKAQALGGVIIAVSFLLFVSMFFLLIVVFKYKGLYEDESSKPIPHQAEIKDN